jgi:predicted permease
MSWLHAARARLRLLLAPRAAEARMDDEMRFHVEMETARLMRERGLDEIEARRQALIAFGGVDRHKEEMRDGRGHGWLGGLSLDLKLALRMLRKHPGLSVVSVLGMAVAIAIGAGAFAVISAVLDPALPLHEGDRIVAIQNENAKHPGSPERQMLHDFALWRGRLTTVRDLSAYTAERRTLVLRDGSADLVAVAHITASGFRVARVAPVLGRPLLDADEREGAPPVLVIAHEEWQRRFGGDPGIIGRPIRLGSAYHLVVGVMPAGFRFPLNHRFWVPLRLDPADHAPGSGPELHLFGRLADGATMEEARAEIAAVGPADAARRSHLRPQVLPYTHTHLDIDNPGTALAFRGITLAISLLLVVVAVNVSVLVYARTAARVGEIAVRTALGASRRRVVGQLFAEALVLSAIAAAIGLSIAGVGLKVGMDFLRVALGGELPFWFDVGLSPGVVAYAAGLAVLAGVIVGVAPALEVTGKRVHAGLQQLSSRGSRMQLGRTWTLLIVAQVAVAVAVLPYAGYVAWQSLRRGTTAPVYPVDQILRARVVVERTEAPPAADAAVHDSLANALLLRRAEELVRRLKGEPGVAGVTFASAFPGEERYARVEVEGGVGTERVRFSRTDVDLLDVLGIPVVAGRRLAASDVRTGAGKSVARDGGAPLDNEEAATAALVDAVLAERMGATGGVLGRRVRLVRRTGGDEASEERIEKGPWLEVVGVMPDFTVQGDILEPADAKLYLPASLAGVVSGGHGVNLAVRLRGTSAPAFAARFRALAAAVDPALQLHDMRSAADLHWRSQQALRLMGVAVAAVTVSVLLLSAAGIYAMMSFTVARRRREIGIRAALGADPRRLLGGIFARAGAQLGTGVMVGVLLAAAVGGVAGGLLSGERLLLLPLAAGLMFVIGLLAALGPARQGLAVQPTEALREE